VAGNPGRVIGRLPGGAAPAPDRNGHKPDSAAAPVAVPLDIVMAILRNVLGTEDLQPDEDFYDAGVTSIMVLPLLVEIEQRLGVSLSQDDFLDARTGQQLAARIGG
jgi:acyl carrier protein